MHTFLVVVGCFVLSALVLYGIEWFRHGAYWVIWRGKRSRRQARQRRLA